ncbi:unnamed protein product [marine sediment metagenome]|uniref:Uncharacterized protein n=1 Tax=marine sediment metagenome TaxID=412755 RepID=X1AE74_9ZZZZ
MNELVVFDEIAATIAEYKIENEKLVFDYADKEGAKQAKSHIMKLRKVKTKVSEIHKEAKAESRAFGLRLDSKKNEYNGEVDKMVAVHKEPLDAIEAEIVAKAMEEVKKREEAEEKRLLELHAREQAVLVAEEKIAREKAEAEEKIARGKAILAEKLIKEQAEAERIERERLAEIERIKREKRIAEEAAARAKIEAEEAAERARIQAEQKAKAEADARELAEKKQKEAAKAAEMKRIANKRHRQKI